SIDNYGSTKLVKNIPLGGINRVESTYQYSKIRSQILLNISHLIEQSLKQIDEYRFKIENYLFHIISNKNSTILNQTNYIKDKSFIKFPQRPSIPIELFQKTNQFDLNYFINYSNIDQSNEINTLIGRYDITNRMNPTNDNYIINQRINKISEYISENPFEYIEEYSKYLKKLLNEYIKDDLYENIKSKINSLSLCEQIKDFFKKLNQRYRIIVQVYIEQHLDQSIIIASRSLWDNKYDTFIQETVFKKNIFILVIIFFIYKQ
ncbi:unnamed protein product, partial [Rotaria sordida]